VLPEITVITITVITSLVMHLVGKVNLKDIKTENALLAVLSV